MHPLDYLRAKGDGHVEALCKRAGTTIAYYRQIAYGHRRASPELAKKLEKASGGALVATEMVFATKKQPARSPA